SPSNGNKVFNRNKKESSSSSSGGSVGCFRCGRLGRIKAECPIAKKERAFQATWSDNDDSESDSDQAEQALMAVTSSEEGSSSEFCSKVPSKPTFSDTESSEYDTDTGTEIDFQEVINKKEASKEVWMPKQT
ncbi:hypothetical protein LINPERPRIM_LOCUS11122, partial [Linum perenne]